MPSDYWDDLWRSSDQADVERALDYAQREYSNMRHSISDGMSSSRVVYNSPPSVPTAVVVAGLAVGIVGLLIFFIVLCCVCCKRKCGGRIIRAPPAASAPHDHVHEHHNPLSYADSESSPDSCDSDESDSKPDDL